MSLDRTRRDTKRISGVAGIQVEEQAQRNDLPLPGRQPQQGRHDPRIDGAASDAPNC